LLLSFSSLLVIAGVGASDADFQALATPLADTSSIARVQFAGEFSSVKYRGTVHGSYYEGKRAAAAVLATAFPATRMSINS
jgi:hypothetical protein